MNDNKAQGTVADILDAVRWLELSVNEIGASVRKPLCQLRELAIGLPDCPEKARILAMWSRLDALAKLMENLGR